MFKAVPRHSIDFSREEFGVFQELLRRREILEGGWQEKFPALFSDYIGVKYSIPVASGKLAFYLMLNALGYENGDEVILSSYNYYAIPEIIRICGLKPVFVDIETKTFNIDIDLIRNSITGRTRAILATHMFGYPCRMDRIKEIAGEHDLDILEDCAHSCGSEFLGKKTGSFSKAALFSFSLLKMPTTLGGGMVVTDYKELFEKIMEQVERIEHDRKVLPGQLFFGGACCIASQPLFFTLGIFPALWLVKKLFPSLEANILKQEPKNIGSFIPAAQSKFTNLQAALGSVQLKRLDGMIKKRRNNSQYFNGLLERSRVVAFVEEEPAVKCNYLYYNVLADDPGLLSKKLYSRGIDAPLSEFVNCTRLSETTRREIPNAEYVEAGILRIPNSSLLSRKEIEYIGRTVEALV